MQGIHRTFSVVKSLFETAGNLFVVFVETKEVNKHPLLWVRCSSQEDQKRCRLP